MKRIIFSAVLALPGFGCPASPAEQQAAQHQASQYQAAQQQASQQQASQAQLKIAVTDAWIRWLPADVPGAGYMTLTNRGPVAQSLVGASSPEYGAITLHQTRTAHALRAMTPVESISLAPNETVKFEELGYHLMLMPGSRRVRPGDRVSITLHFAGGRSMTVPFEIRADGP